MMASLPCVLQKLKCRHGSFTELPKSTKAILPHVKLSLLAFSVVSQQQLLQLLCFYLFFFWQLLLQV
jgi:hypothetical protein